MNGPPHRRADDPRIEELQDDVKDLKRQMAVNTEITKEVHDILASFRIVGAVAKWVGVVAGALTAVYGAWYALFHGINPPR